MRRRLLPALLLVALAGCAPAQEPPAAEVVVYMLDSPVDAGFVEGRPVGLALSEVSHGSLVGRVLRSYCRAPIVVVPVQEPEGTVSRAAYLEGLRTALRDAAAHPERRIVVNVSLASDEPEGEEEDLVRRLTAAGALVVAAAGNDGADVDTYPAAYPGVIAVASATRAGKAPSSNYGAHVAIAASGDISFIDYEFLPNEWLRRRTEAEGTSFAAPRVAATLAYLMMADPELTPAGAWNLMQSTARPIDDPLFGGGLLGAGLLDVYRAKSAVWPAYRFVHYFLPAGLFVSLAAVTAYLCVRFGSVGVFVSLMMWLLAVPASVLLVVKLTAYLEFVGGGSLLIGATVAAVLCAGAALAALIGSWQPKRAAAATAPPYAVLAVLALAGATRQATAVAWSSSAALAAVAIAVVLEARARRQLARIRALGERVGSEDARRLVALCRRTWDRRIRAEAFAALGRARDPSVVELLLGEERHAAEATTALAEIAGRHPRALEPCLARMGELDEDERKRLSEAVLAGAAPETTAAIEEIARRSPSDELGRLLVALRRGEPDAP